MLVFFFWEASEIKNVVSGFLYYLERPCESFIKGYKRHSFFLVLKLKQAGFVLKDT